MPDRITAAMLDKQVKRLNRALGRPELPWIKDAAGNLVSQDGCLHIDSAYGGVNLGEMHGAGGGVSLPLGCARMSKRALWDMINAMLWATSAQGQMAQSAKIGAGAQ